MQKKSSAKPTVKIFSVDRDKVVRALVATARTNYEFAIDKLVPLIDRLEIQRRIQNPKFYERLKRDLLKGCVMPPITLAFVRKSQSGLSVPSNFEKFVNENIGKAFVLDGIQRLSTLKRAHSEHPEELELSQPLFVNVLVCPSMDNLLYRMITLNNGQKPMTTRHQIEILSANKFDVSNGNIILSTEKAGERKKWGIFAQADFVLGYMAFMSNSINVDSQKLIQEKLDELIASKILEHDPSELSVDFTEVCDLIGNFCSISATDKWFKITNNLVGFCAGIRSGYTALKGLSGEEFSLYIQTIEDALKSLDASKIKVGRVRREVVAHCIADAEVLLDGDADDITERILSIVES